MSAPTICKFWIGRIIRTFPPIDFATNNVEIFDRRISWNISSNQFRHQQYWNFWSEDLYICTFWVTLFWAHSTDRFDKCGVVHEPLLTCKNTSDRYVPVPLKKGGKPRQTFKMRPKLAPRRPRASQTLPKWSPKPSQIRFLSNFLRLFFSGREFESFFAVVWQNLFVFVRVDL